MYKIRYKVKTESNCLIGNHTQKFQIGGVDQCTTLDETGKKPMIPGSSMKGSSRTIIQLEGSDMEVTKEFYKEYLADLQEKLKLKEGIDDFVKKIEYYCENIKPEYLFGLEGLNTMPHLIFSDLRVEDEAEEDYFLIDTKTAITYERDEISSNPRTYKVVRKGITFYGEILFFGFPEKNEEAISEEVCNKLRLYNEGFYRLGNSKSRGYGKVTVEIQGREEDEAI